MIVEHVEVQTEVTTNYRGKVLISVDSPSGTNSVLTTSRSDSGRNVPHSWKWGTLRTWGEPASGAWTVNVKSLDNNQDRLNRITVTVYGHISA